MGPHEIIRRGDLLTYDGMDVEVIAVDEDPRATVLVVAITNPNRVIQAMRSELS